LFFLFFSVCFIYVHYWSQFMIPFNKNLRVRSSSFSKKINVVDEWNITVSHGINLAILLFIFLRSVWTGWKKHVFAMWLWAVFRCWYSKRCTTAIEHEFLGLKWRSNFTPLLAVICSTSRLIVWKCICLSATMVLW
jgi:hypothetical protein